MSGKTWFSKAFGFLESDTYKENCAQFQFDPATHILTSLANGQLYYVGPFETPSVGELRSRLPASPPRGPPALELSEIVGDIREMHSREKNRGAVIMVASQFNALEMVGPGVSPEKGITNYIKDQTQGPACALACPGGTVYRNYCHGGRGQGGGEARQINNLKDVGAVVGPKQYWKMHNGYSLPLTGTSMQELGHRLATEDGLSARVMDSVRVGVHWDTQVGTTFPTDQRVCQVFCSALPCSYCHVTKNIKDWTHFACAVLSSAFEATLCVAALISLQRPGQRVRVLLTRLGMGAFGNQAAWVRPAIDTACAKYAAYPLDVYIVKFGSTPVKEK